MAGIYIHIPFCKQACYYCDFHFSTNTQIQEELVAAIGREIELQKDYLNDKKIETIYFGGGTPSLLTNSQLKNIFAGLSRIFDLRTATEITLEANPDDLSFEKLEMLRANGINRLSIGIQSFDEKILKFLNRSHSAVQAKDCVENARRAGFSNISMDLIYAIPKREQQLLRQELETLLSLQPEHISAYSLTIEEKTVFGNWYSRKKFNPVSDDDNAEQFITIMEQLGSAGYEHYEISNYAKPGFISQHNSNYWKQKSYLGLGPSAHSFNGNSRQANISNNYTYVNAIREGKVPFMKEELTRESQINEFIMTSLRTSWGCNLAFLKQEYEYDLLTDQGNYIAQAIKKGLMQVQGGFLILTPAGKLHADKLSADLFLVD